jgi:hypothetical protein
MTCFRDTDICRRCGPEVSACLSFAGKTSNNRSHVMSGFGNLVAEAILAPEGSAARADAERQLTCKMAASTHIMCACGAIFDQGTICILERTWTDGHKSHTVQCCPKCRAVADDHLRKLLDRKMKDGSPAVEGTFSWLTWAAQEEVARTCPPA